MLDAVIYRYTDLRRRQQLHTQRHLAQRELGGVGHNQRAVVSLLLLVVVVMVVVVARSVVGGFRAVQMQVLFDVVVVGQVVPFCRCGRQVGSPERGRRGG